MKKRIISVFTLALMLASILMMSAIPASAKSGFNDVLEFSATASGYVVNDTTAVFVRIALSFAKSVDFARTVLSSATTAVPVKTV